MEYLKKKVIRVVVSKNEQFGPDSGSLSLPLPTSLPLSLPPPSLCQNTWNVFCF